MREKGARSTELQLSVRNELLLTNRIRELNANREELLELQCSRRARANKCQ